jgi:hypothetical protein
VYSRGRRKTPNPAARRKKKPIVAKRSFFIARSRTV